MVSPNNKLIGQRIKQRRKDLKLTCQQLGDRVCYAKSRISEIENGKTGIDIDKLVSFAKALDTNIIYFISDLK